LKPTAKPVLLCSLACFLLLSVPATARTLRVAQDGSGDYTAIQPAIDWATPGDTISIGAGVYTECHTIRLPGWSWSIEIYAYVRKDNLTLIGDDPESVIIGPETANFWDFGPIGIATTNICTNLRVEKIQVRNVYDGIYINCGRLEAEDCHFTGCGYGICLFVDDGAFIDSCRFEGCKYDGVIAANPSDGVVIQDSYFWDCEMGISMDSATNVTVSNCEILGDGTVDNCRVGIQYATFSTGTISNCRLRDCSFYGVTVVTHSEVQLLGNEISGGQVNLYLRGVSTVTGSNNDLSGGTYATILDDGSMFEMHGNHILNAGGSSVMLGYGWESPPDRYLNLRDNFWGTTDGDQIAEWIWDGNDDPNIHGFVLYEPFNSGPDGTEQQSWGQVKALYR
jgi:hypothetical protein